MSIVLKTVELSKNYSKTKVLNNLDINIYKGEIVGLVGANGSGKTTLMKTLINLIMPTSGNANIFDKDIIKYNKDLKKNIGYISFEDNLYEEQTGLENLNFFSKIQAIETKKAKSRIDELAKFFNVDLSRKICELSKGNKRKISIIKAFLNEPNLFILDDPTSGLDPLAKSRFFELLETQRKKESTVFFSSHNLSEIDEICDRVIFIKNGAVSRSEKISDLKNKTIEVFFKKNYDFYEQTKSIASKYKLENIQAKGNKLSFNINGGSIEIVKDILNNDTNQNIIDIMVQKLDLESIFMQDYI